MICLTSRIKEGIPHELEEAADIDGCGRYKRFFKVILPLCTPGLSTLAIYNGVNIWNEFIFMQDKLVKGMMAGAVKG